MLVSLEAGGQSRQADVPRHRSGSTAGDPPRPMSQVRERQHSKRACLMWPRYDACSCPACRDRRRCRRGLAHGSGTGRRAGRPISIGPAGRRRCGDRTCRARPKLQEADREETKSARSGCACTMWQAMVASAGGRSGPPPRSTAWIGNESPARGSCPAQNSISPGSSSCRSCRCRVDGRGCST